MSSYEVKINLNNMEKFADFVSKIRGIDCDINIVSDPCVVDAKSIMGLFSLDLSKPVILRANVSEDNTFIINQINTAVAGYIA